MRITWRACSSPDHWVPTSASLTQPAWSGPREAAFLTGSQVMLILLIWDNCCPESLQDCCRFAVRSLFQRQFLRGAILEFLAVASLHLSPFSLYCIVFFWLHLEACWILVLRPNPNPRPSINPNPKPNSSPSSSPSPSLTLTLAVALAPALTINLTLTLTLTLAKVPLKSGS